MIRVWKRREPKPRCAACGRKGHVMVDCPDLEPRTRRRVQGL